MTRINYTKIGYIIMITIFSAAFIIMSSGCSNEPVSTEDELSPAYEPAPDTTSDTDTSPGIDDGSEAIEVKTGEKFSISLQSNPTTGYSWQAEFDSEFIELVESEFVPSSSGLIGACGEEILVFLARREGQVEIKLKYQRPWEDQPIQEQSRKVNVTDSGVSILNGKAGETITISLISNPTTGYSWHPEFDSDFLELVNTEFISDSPMLGSPGMETFEFLMLKQGEVKVKMTYKRPWENEILNEHVTLIIIHP